MTGYLRRSRQGLSILELLLLITVSSMLMSIVGIWLHKLLLFASLQLDRQRDHMNIQRLASELRQDVQMAESWSFTQPNELELMLSDNTRIVYRLKPQPDGNQIETIYPAAAQPAPPAADTSRQAMPRQECYRFTSNCDLKWDTTEFPQTLTLVIFRKPTLAHALPPPSSTSSLSQTSDRTGQSASVQPDIVQAPQRQPVEAVIQLKTNRWNSQISRIPGALP
jgi:hypothetical protein